jgi:3-oxo-5-alpha-steroid 4-dehydrogenase 3 / polyprenol reductase
MFSNIFALLSSFSLVDFIFINFIITMLVLGNLVIFFESYIPTSIAQSFRYGKHAVKGKTDKFVSKLEIPKSCFKHFYLYAFVWSIFLWTVTFNAYFRGVSPPRIVILFLDVVCGKNRLAQSEYLYKYV